ncbi:unnamed protein product [Heligmosomoides polygyrus]|uniref:Helicase C-terminal domain-containing protein n=1 Tax=Heligmosomoides polygyrus TaxID=6339 RepID=A0A3P7XMB8_HELPZ|nr:unnamed protein product [Heligmosomoides polygyrus]
MIGIKQYVAMCNEPAVECLVRLLKSVQFNQALVFCNLHQQCEPTCSRLEREGFLAAYISAQMVQTERDSVIEKLKQNKLKVLVSTDLYFLFFLTARGIDASSVNLVVNLETAINLETYFHRIGRAARYAAVTILAEPRVIGRFKAMTWKGGVNVRCLDLDRVPPDLTTSQSFFDSCVPFKASGKEQSVGRENNVAGSKSKAESPQILQDVDVRGQNGMAYDRETVVALSREPEIPLSEEMQDYLKDIGILTTVHLNGVRNLPSTTSEQVASPNRSDKAVNPQQSSHSPNVFNSILCSQPSKFISYSSMTYDRQTVVSLSKSEAPLTEEKQQYLEEIGIATTSPVNGVKSFATEMAELNEKILQSKMADMNLKARPDPVPEEKPKKFKFVPSREKAKRKFYMRGELLGIRDSVSRYSWRKYAESKFDLSAEPFIPFKEDSQSKEDVNAGGDGPQRTRNIKTAKRSKAPPSESDRKRYSRKDMIAIQNSVPKKAWIPYVKSRWDTTQEPFELNQFLRCSFEERLRRQRQLEKKQRDEVIRSRQKAQQEKPKLLASARTPCQLPVAESSFDMFCTRVKEEYEKFREQRQTLGNLGAVVPHRDPPEVWRAEVDYHTRWLQNFDSMFKYDVYKEAGRRCEVAVETQLEELPSANSSPSPGSALETESAVNASCVAVKDWTASEQSASSERNMSEEGETGDSGVAQSAYPPEFSDDVNDDSGDVEDSIEQSSQSEISRGNTFESGMDEEGEVTLDESSSCDEEASVEMEAERLRPFVEAYRRNVDFHLVFSSYLWLLNRKYH